MISKIKYRKIIYQGNNKFNKNNKNNCLNIIVRLKGKIRKLNRIKNPSIDSILTTKLGKISFFKLLIRKTIKITYNKKIILFKIINQIKILF